MTSIACTLSSGEFSCEVLVPADLFYNLAVAEWMKKQGDQEFLWKQRLSEESVVVVRISRNVTADFGSS